MSDPSDSGIPPNWDDVELALRVAEHERRSEPAESYWHGAVDALKWALELRDGARVGESLPDAADRGIRRKIGSEAEAVYWKMRQGGAGQPMRYLTGIENTLMWVSHGRGFAQPLDRDWLREHLGIE